ncbi:hypothetical protein DLAC_09220 [Tieghemostelium lacteum]|uniref:F-box domain-containing protein n=1 Tax=Tieghemostelium lacteum TaxID=361077 RepID=A0A151Z9H5_TIELA|nr:hypothetical protein DLAC_09220 [Tieghemostelium lacteum]|eukprot:KYQ90592.1 hypothetical protein DLAC_09220 [Tieghemostelium lacteum]
MDEENLARLLQAFSNCNYIEFVKIFSMIHGFDATFEFLRNALTTIPFMAFKKKFWMFGGDDEKNPTPKESTAPNPPTKRSHIRSTWEDENDQEFWNTYKPPIQPQPPQSPNIYYDSDHDYHKNRNSNSPKTSKSNINIKSNSPQPQQQQQQQQLIQKNNFNNSKYSNNNNNINNNKLNNSNNISTDIKMKNVNNLTTKQARNAHKKKNYMKNIQELPFELIIFIFSFLSSSDLLQASIVSREWSRYSFVATSELIIDNRKSMTVDIVNKKIYKHSDYLKKIEFSQSKIIGYSSVRMIVDHCRNLQDLEFHHCPLINDSEIDLVCTLLMKLQKIVIHSESLTVKTFESLCKSPRLEAVQLGGFSRLPLETFQKLSEIKNLQSLDVSKIAKVLCSAIKGCVKLTSLRLSIATESTIASLPFLSQLEMLSIDEWDLEDEVQSQNQDTNSMVITVPTQESDGSYLKFLEKCNRLVKFEITGSDDFVIHNFSTLLIIQNTLRVLDLDLSYGGGGIEENFRYVIPHLYQLESLFITKFSLNGETWEAFSRLPKLHNLSLCCNKLNSHWLNRGIEHISKCKSLERISIINSTEHWIDISEKSFASLSNLSNQLLELRLGGSRGGGMILNEGVFMTIGKISTLKTLDLSNSRGISEQCFIHLSQCSSLEYLEGSVKIDEQIIQNTVAEWCGTGTLVNCPSLRKVSFDIKLPSYLNSEISCPNSLNSFNLITKLSQ